METTSIRKAIQEFTQGISKTFHKAWEHLRDCTRECPHHGVSNHERMQIFYDGLGPGDRYLLDAASSNTLLNKYEDKARELIKMVAKNSLHNAAKLCKRGAMPKGQQINAKSGETRMFLEIIDKMAEVQNLLLDSLNICIGSEELAPVSLQPKESWSLPSQTHNLESCSHQRGGCGNGTSNIEPSE